MSFKQFLLAIIDLGENMKKDLVFGWQISEIIALFDEINSRGQMSKVEIFSDIANRFGREEHSVRNFYYKVFRLVDKAGGVNEWLKQKDYKNIYTFTLPNKGELSEKNLSKIEASVANKGNLTPLVKSTEILSKNEIESLFWGLVKIVKRNAEKEVQLNTKRELEFANTTLSNTLIALKRKEVLLKELRSQNAILTEKLNRLKKRDNERSKNIENDLNFLVEYAKSNSLDEFRAFLEYVRSREIKNEKLYR